MTAHPLTCSTHVLDTTLGVPAAGMAVHLGDAEGKPLASGVTDPDGRVRFDVALEAGEYVLTFDTGEWFLDAERATFFPLVVVRFVAGADQSHYHVPLLLGPYSYTTYRGS